MVFLRVTGVLLLGLVSVTFAGCAGPSRGAYLEMKDMPQGAKPIPVYVATSRKRTKDGGEMFTGERAVETDFARIVVSIPPNHEVGKIEWGTSKPLDPSTSFALVSHEYLARNAVLSDLKADLAKRKSSDREVLVFIHGYNTSFDSGAFLFSQILADSNYHGVPVMFTWPSRNRLLSYPYDRESALYSRDDLAAVLEELASLTDVKKIHIMAHSMGNMVTLEALRETTLTGKTQLQSKIGQIMLASPDVDKDVFLREFEKLGKLKRSVTMFVSKDDKALAASRLFWGDSTRIGALDLKDTEIVKALTDMGLTIVDLSEVKGDDLSHSKFAQSPAVVQLIGQQISVDAFSKTTTFADRLAQFNANLSTEIGQEIGYAVSLPGSVATRVVGGEEP